MSDTEGFFADEGLSAVTGLAGLVAAGRCTVVLGFLSFLSIFVAELFDGLVAVDGLFEADGLVEADGLLVVDGLVAEVGLLWFVGLVTVDVFFCVEGFAV